MTGMAEWARLGDRNNRQGGKLPRFPCANQTDHQQGSNLTVSMSVQGR